MSMDRIDRTEHIQRTLEEKVSKVGADAVYRNDPQYAAQIYQLVDTLTLVDEAMENEGLSKETRDIILDECFNGISKHTDAAIRLAKAEKILVDLLSNWDDE